MISAESARAADPPALFLNWRLQSKALIESRMRTIVSISPRKYRGDKFNCRQVRGIVRSQKGAGEATEERLLHRDRLGEVSGLVYVAAAADCYVIGQQLHGDNFHERRERLDDMRDVDHTLH